MRGREGERGRGRKEGREGEKVEGKKEEKEACCEKGSDVGMYMDV